MAKKKNTVEGNEPTELPKPTVTKSKRLSWMWFVPLVALFLGLVLVKRHVDDLGELVEVSLPSAEGLFRKRLRSGAGRSRLVSWRPFLFLMI